MGKAGRPFRNTTDSGMPYDEETVHTNTSGFSFLFLLDFKYETWRPKEQVAEDVAMELLPAET